MSDESGINEFPDSFQISIGNAFRTASMFSSSWQILLAKSGSGIFSLFSLFDYEENANRKSK